MSKKNENIETAVDKTVVEENQVSKSNAKHQMGKEISLKEYSKNAPFAYNAKNYKLLLIGLGVNLLGFFLMMGGATTDPNKFDANELFSTTRITIAPMLIVAGYGIIMYGIMKKNSKGSADSE